MMAARDHFTEQKASYEIGTATTEGVIQASKELLQAELAMPIVPSDQLAWLAYLDRTRHLQRKKRAMARLAMFDSFEAMERTQDLADELLDECHSVEDRLGLPHVDNDYFRTMKCRRYEASEMDDENQGEADSGEPAPPAPDE